MTQEGKPPVAPNRFTVGQGRERPAYEPIAHKCPNCGGDLEVKDEQAQLVVCPYCGSHLEMSQTALTALGRRDESSWAFPLAVGDRFQHRGLRFEVIARMALIEDGDAAECTRQYYLFNPRLGSMWLSEYDGHWSLSTGCHVMPTVLGPFAGTRGDLMTTHDGREWVCEETGEYQLAYVDGALPWLAKVGDVSQYAEFSSKDGAGDQFEVERTVDEVEYGTGRALSPDEVRKATGKKDLPVSFAKLVDAGTMRSSYLTTLKVAAVLFAINLAFVIGASSRGKVVLEQSFAAEALNGEVLTRAFELTEPNRLIKVVVDATLNNAWMVVDLAVVTAGDQVVHVFDNDISYYHGSEGGESWSEGGTTETTYIKIPDPGSYRLLLHARSASGNAAQAERAEHSLGLWVEEGVVMPHFLIGSSVLSAAALLLMGIAYGSWKKAGTDDDDEDD